MVSRWWSGESTCLFVELCWPYLELDACLKCVKLFGNWMHWRDVGVRPISEAAASRTVRLQVDLQAAAAAPTASLSNSLLSKHGLKCETRLLFLMSLLCQARADTPPPCGHLRVSRACLAPQTLSTWCAPELLRSNLTCILTAEAADPSLVVPPQGGLLPQQMHCT